MYEICYDFIGKKTLWTRHKVLTPVLLTHKDYPHKDLDIVDLKAFNTDTFSLGVYDRTFADMKHEYESVNTNMKIYPLVPKEHMALPYWKKSTDHMINSAPILPEFIPLMKAIHNGILLASNHVHRKFHQTLRIYTKAETIYTYKHRVSSALFLKPLMKTFFPVISTEVFRPSIWYIIVHNESTKSAVLIVLHNTKEALPEKKECDRQDMLSCYFESWAENPDSINKNVLKNAYCCVITQERAENLFSIAYLEIRKTLDIQEIINPMKDQII
ncbi:uncharacterized protein LOC135833690 [Planococcus citri]|uniref:uncharacterized protein LOC135833690 n=1 Tax=Planococcus citri TaxID=170843 RepID=UPI0031F9B044